MSNIANVKCEKCGRIVAVTLLTQEVDREERDMGAEVQYDTTGQATCECGNEITYSQSEWEYPEGVPNHSESAKVTGGDLV
ncbi:MULTISPECIES: hypothetical protein [Burkholderia]|uniref:Uncharacterized protein n=1 Tax=Burkholderia pseudomultivorans TaxID=1207504 RepID=A0ABU2ED07_9BURK|nr:MULTISPECIES: hypothetical protein [Burkholderia]MDR8731347.1 hypothetical protein [Burkholderia pseudomultivorans]MDR8738968.1 hypothetical protein [Burkholderia pseudomultivorans]MDR8745519.1 hypothetical protein [Burkholderia pseudomultivorans]MDR8757779.1 hypothetical protein [Burkholderia pseudomultivorans]MDR8781879.1 hypothetical protein [Burkholderia pseudomultivorans]